MPEPVISSAARPNGAYLTGVALVASSIVMVAAGGTLAVDGAASTGPEPNGSRALITTGLIVLGMGATFGVTGGALASSFQGQNGWSGVTTKPSFAQPR